MNESSCWFVSEDRSTLTESEFRLDESGLFPRKEIYYHYHDTTSVHDVCWFDMPMDLRILEQLNVMDFLATYAHIPQRKVEQYKRAFDRYSQLSKLPIEKTYQALQSITVCKLPQETVKFTFELMDLNVDDWENIDLPTFNFVCLTAERIIFTKLLKHNNVPLPPKHILEMIEFDRLRQSYFALQLNKPLQLYIDRLLL